MDADTALALQSDEEWEATPEAAAGARAEAIRRDLHTSMPGIIKSYDAKTQTAVVQPALQRVWRGVGPLDLPLCPDVPIYFPAGGGFVLTFPVAPGDECQLNFNERAIDYWFDRGGVQLPSEVRFHDLSDAFAYVGFSSKPRFLASVAVDAAELRTRDGSMVIRLEAGGIKLNGGTNGVARVTDPVTLTLSPIDLQALAAALLTTGGFLPAGGPPNPGATPLPLTGGKITAGSTTVKAGG